MSCSGPSRPEPSRDATGDENATVTVPVAGGAWCKGGLSVAVTRPLGRMRVRAVGKKPYVESVGVLVGEQHRHVKKPVACGLARQMMGGCKGATNEM